MPLHDRYLRATPYERIFPDPDTRDRVLEAIGREVEERGMGDGDPGAFALLARTREALADLRDPSDSDDGGHTHAVLFFHAYHLRTSGAPHLLATVPVSRWAVEGPSGTEKTDEAGTPGASREAVGPAGAAGPEGEPRGPEAGLPRSVYVQLPQHLFWVREDAAERPRSLDGFFWTVTGTSLHVLGVVDLQPGRGAIRVLPLPAVPFDERELWLSEEMREGGSDFRSEIPGSEMEGLYELRTAGELLKLAARLDRFVVRFPDAGRNVEPASDGPDESEPPAAMLPYRRLALD